MIALAAGEWRAQVLPELGGAIGRLDWRGKPVLRVTPPNCDDVLQTACFPLAPYANRIDHGRFTWAGREIDIGVTPGFAPHALHGLGWRRAWSIEDVGADRVRLRLCVDADAWPWAWSAAQVFVLDEEGLRIDLSLTNDSHTPMPGGLGLHPYLACGPADRVRFQAGAVWLGKTLIPETQAPPATIVDWSAGPSRAALPFVDNAYEAWSGQAEVISADRTTRLTSDASRLHAYAPVGEAFVCLEPVTHRPDAHNASPAEASGLQTLAPGETMTLSMRITAR